MPAPATTTAHAVTTAHPRSYYEGIVDRDIFNLVPVEAPAPSAPVIEDLHLTLLGVSIISGGKSFAVIEDRTGQQSIYRVGEYVPDAGTLIQVDAKRAVIDRNGKHVAIELPKDEMPAGVQSAKPVPVMSAPPDEDNTNDSNDNDEDSAYDPNVSELGENHYGIPKGTIDHSVHHMAELFTQVRAIPNIQNGKTTGFSLTEIEPGSVFDQMGFEDGDVLNTVDGQSVDDPMKAMQMLNVLNSRRRIQVQVMRDGRPVTITYEIQ
jgi:general secretion pathway protein C